MEANKILETDVLDILFENRNKSYGAYELRKRYHSRLSIALMVMGGLVGIAFLSSFFYEPPVEELKPKVSVVELIDVVVPTKVEEVEEVKPKELKPVRTEQFVTMRIEPDEKVSEEQKPPTVDELANAAIGTADVEGEGDDRVRVEGEGKVEASGVVEKPEVKNDEPFIRVEVEAEFPGGNKAWHKYISREIERNMDELQDDGKSGTVVVQFVVDAEGNVSDVKILDCATADIGNCLGAGAKLSEIAVAAIRRGPKWKAAIQNGRQVKAYRRQPITFRLSESE